MNSGYYKRKTIKHTWYPPVSSHPHITFDAWRPGHTNKTHMTKLPRRASKTMFAIYTSPAYVTDNPRDSVVSRETLLTYLTREAEKISSYQTYDVHKKHE
ncbi:hypothetical protein MAR_007077 [Mya arenaria]|uniref:Uncharacterized protein n=1 Tax=Mya arenaria TaxID=6604 RepID=A0ABY7DAB5_MYAAR|nr:hypothetical protein MAR_007077 [Mya arenaria]